MNTGMINGEDTGPELLYVWIKSYMGIKEQGFNLSPRFNLHFNEKEGWLKWEQNSKDIGYCSVPGFESPGVRQVTAIIGKNGSGKTSLFRAILALFHNEQCKKEERIQLGEAFLVFWRGEFEREEYFEHEASQSPGREKQFEMRMLKVPEKFSVVNRMKKEIYTDQGVFGPNEGDLNYRSCIYYNHTLEDIGLGSPLGKGYFGNTGSNYRLIPDKSNGIINLREQRQAIERAWHSTIEDRYMEPDCFHFFRPTHVNIDVETSLACVKPEYWMFFLKRAHQLYQNGDLEPALYVIPFDVSYSISEETLLTLHSSSQRQIEAFNEMHEKINNMDSGLMKSKYCLAYALLGVYIELLGIDPRLWREMETYLASTSPNFIDLENILGFPEHLKASNSWHRINVHDINEPPDKISSRFRFLVAEMNGLESWYSMYPKLHSYLKGSRIAIQEIPEDIFDMFGLTPEFVILDYEECKGENRKRFSTLSGGERCLLQQVLLLNDAVNAMHSNHSLRVLLLDEADLGLHPTWQKEHLNYLFSIGRLGHNVQLIYATHSPFIASDLPRANVRLLEDGKELNDQDLKTFGANIHTLLAKNFFLEGGVMGFLAQQYFTNSEKTFRRIRRDFEDYKDGEVEKLGVIGEALEDLNFQDLVRISNEVGEPILARILCNNLRQMIRIAESIGETELSRKYEQLLKKGRSQEL